MNELNTNAGRPEENAFTFGAAKSKNMFGNTEADNRVPDSEPEVIKKKEEKKTGEEMTSEKERVPKQTVKSRKKTISEMLSKPVFKSDDPKSDECIKQYTIYLKPKQVKFCKSICSGMIGVSWSTVVQKMIESYMEGEE